MWGEFWEKQANSRGLIHQLIRWSRSYFSYINFFKKHCTGASLLEAGCGSAESTLRLASETKDITRVTLLDFAPQSMVLARRNARIYGVDADFVLGDIHFMPFKPCSFDFVWNLGVLEHFENPISIIKEMERVIKNGGKIAAIVPFKYTPLQYVSTIILKTPLIITKSYEGFCARVSAQTWGEILWLRGRRELKLKFEEAGLKQVKVHLLLRSFLVDVAVVGEKAGNQIRR